MLAVLLAAALFQACQQPLVDENFELPDRKWFYKDHLKSAFTIEDSTKQYNIYLKLRHTTEYRYANIYTLVHLSDSTGKSSKRYQFQLAKTDGAWLGSGSGSIYTHVLKLYSNKTLAKGHYTIEVEQNMRDNPLNEITDLGIVVTEAKP